MRWGVAAVFYCFGISFAAQGQEQLLSLSRTVGLAREHSTQLQSAEKSFFAASNRAESLRASLWPKLSLEANFRGQTVVPEATFGPKAVPLTDHHSYSVGPTLSWVFWDFGARAHTTASSEAMALAKKDQAHLIAQQVELQAKLSYVQAALSFETSQFATQALALSKAQNEDIQNKYQLGSVSRLDAIASNSEIAQYQLKAQQAKADLAASLSDLSYFLHGGTDRSELDPTLESLEQLLENYRELQRDEIQPVQHVTYRLQSHLQEASLRQADAIRSMFWPTLTLQLRSSLDYPNGPSFERIHQNSIGLNLSWALFDFGATHASWLAQKAEAESATVQKEEAVKSLKRDSQKAFIRAQSLQKQIDDAAEILKNQEKLAQLQYKAYQVGQLSYSEVQNTNLRLLEARNRLALVRAQYLVQVFTLQFLKGEGDDE